MKTFRRLLFWGHLITGVTFGLVVLVMSVTGVLLAYQRQMTAWADTRGYDTAPPTPGAARLPVDALLARVREQRAELAPTQVVMPPASDVDAAVTISARRGDETLFVNAYTGAVLGSGSASVRGFFRSVNEWHRWLAMQGDMRAFGRGITGASNLGFLFLVSSGVYLWWPRTWTWRQLRSVTWFRRGLPGKAREFNWHNTIGFWSCIPLFVIVISGVVMSYPWANALVYRIAGEEPPVPGQAPAPARGPGAPGAPADARGPGEGQGRRGGAGAATVSVTYLSDDAKPQNRTQVTIDSKTGAVIRSESFANYSRGRQLRTWMRFAHTGEFYGVIGQTIAALASTGAALLVYTGLSLAFRRLWRSLFPRVGRLDQLAGVEAQPLGNVAVGDQPLEVPLVQARQE